MSKREVERFKDRCTMICGNLKHDCYISSKEQVKCIADLVINKTTGLTMMLRASLDAGDKEFLEDSVKASLTDIAELSNWIQYLQIVPDLQTLSMLVLDAEGEERRSEIRYPLTEDVRNMLRITFPDGLGVGTLRNFSQSGFQLLINNAVKTGDTMDCHLSVNIPESRMEPLSASVMYCVPRDGMYVCGMRINSIRDDKVFNFFNFVHQFMVDIEMETT